MISIEYFNMLVENLDRKYFGIVIDDPDEFIEFIRDNDCFDIITSDLDDLCNGGNIINGHIIQKVCMSVILNSKGRYVRKYKAIITSRCFINEKKFSPDEIANLEKLMDSLNALGFKCKIGVLTQCI